MRRVVLVVMGVLLAVAVLPLLPATPAGAAPPPPVLLAPADNDPFVFRENPEFSWEETPGATSYQIQVSTSPTMTPLVNGGSFNTTNVTGTFTQDLPIGTLYWRVGSYDATSGPIWSAPRSFTKAPITAPLLTSPANNAVLAYPDTPPNFSWNPVPGAQAYQIIIDNDQNFTPPYTLDTTTANTTYTLTAPQTEDQDYYWRVRARSTSGATGDWASFRRYSFDWIDQPALVSPGRRVSEIPPFTLPVIEQVEFVWEPISGAVQYDIQYSNNIQFSQPDTVRVKSTRYSPPVTLNNGSYFWRVRGVTSTGSTGQFTADPFTFERAWPANAQPTPPFSSITLLAPANQVATAVPRPNFSWTPQRLASSYELQLSTNQTFSSNVSSYITNHTEFTPTGGAPNPGQLYYWRVRAIDAPRPVTGIFTDVFSPVWSFIYHPDLVDITGPAPGSYDAPKLTWNPASSTDISRYRVTIYNKNGQPALVRDTYNTSFYPTDLAAFDPDPAKNVNPYTFAVQTLDDAGRPGPLPVSQNPFTVVAPTTTYATANPTGPSNPSSTRVPPLTWRPVTGAVKYNVQYSPAGAGLYQTLANNQTTPGYSHTLSNVSAGSYDWRVQAVDVDNSPLGFGTVGQFTVTLLSNTVLTSPENCPPNAACALNYDTPTLKWDPVPGATGYTIFLSFDVNFTNQVPSWPRATMFNQYTPPESLPDNQAGQAYYWYAQPRYGSPSQAGRTPQSFVADPPNSPVKAFRKIAKPVPLLTPTPGQKITGSQVTFTWQGFLQTNQSGALVDRVTQEARQYRVQVSDRADFSNIIDTSPPIDQTTYTAYDKTYPEGQLWWRVVIIDGSQNLLTLPPPETFTKETPKVVLVGPPTAPAVPGTPTLTWTPQKFVRSYEVEVYKNVTQPLTDANRVFLANTQFPSATPTAALPAGQYGWRVRRFDADNRAGAWSAETNTTLRKFTIAGTAATLLTPSDNATADPNRLTFSWTKVNSAVRYIVETNTSPTFTNANTEAVTTVMNSWAPRAPYVNGRYYWRVKTLDAAGNTVATSNPFTFSAGVAGSRYVSISPDRILDSRGPNGGWNARLGNNATRSLKVAGGSLPAPITATAVVLNVTAVESTAPSFLTLFPTGSPRPTAGSNLNFSAGQIIPNLVTVKVGTNGNVDFYNAVGTVNVVADMVGYYEVDAGDRFNPLTPDRLLDSRITAPSAWTPAGALNQGQTKQLQITGRGGVPTTATSAIVNITAVEGSAQSFLMAYPTGSPQPVQASNLNFLPGQIIPNLAIVKLGTGGRINLFNAQGSVNVIVDVVGYFEPSVGSYFHELEPDRILDTRLNNGLTGKFQSNQARALQVTGRGGVPLGANGVVMNTTAVEGTAPSYLTLYPDGVGRPTGSNLNFSPGQIIPNLTTVKLSAAGRVLIYNNSGQVDVLADVVGYYSNY